MAACINDDGRYSNLGTSRISCTRKLETLLDFCKMSGMIINQSKTKFMVVNVSENDKTPLRIEYGDSHFEFHWCDVYIYILGAFFTGVAGYLTLS